MSRLWAGCFGCRGPEAMPRPGGRGRSRLEHKAEVQLGVDFGEVVFVRGAVEDEIDEGQAPAKMPRAMGPMAASRLDREAEVARDDAGEVQDAVRKPYESLERAVSL